MRSIVDVIFSIPGIILAITFHSYAKAKMADKLGDKTPRFQGRLTLNPLSHVDPIGTLLMLVVGIGWSKPVETNPRVYKDFYKDDLKVNLAGPIANLCVALIAGIVASILYAFIVKFRLGETALPIILNIITSIVGINVTLAIFYMLPIPGMDGFNIFRDLSPKNFYKYAEPMMRYQVFILIGVILIGGVIIRIPASLIINLIYSIGNLISGILF